MAVWVDVLYAASVLSRFDKPNVLNVSPTRAAEGWCADTAMAVVIYLLFMFRCPEGQTPAYNSHYDPLPKSSLDWRSSSIRQDSGRPQNREHASGTNESSSKVLTVLCRALLVLFTLCSAFFAVLSQAANDAHHLNLTVLDLLRNIRSIAYVAGAADMGAWHAALLNAVLLAVMSIVVTTARINLTKREIWSTSKLVPALLFLLAGAFVSYASSLFLDWYPSTRPPLVIEFCLALIRQPWAPTEVDLSKLLMGDSLSAAAFYSPALYGFSNIDNPLRWSDVLVRKEYKHVFVIWLESADAEVWPWSDTYCNTHGCGDLDEKYNSAQHMTPFFHEMSQSALFVPNFMTNVALSSKSDHSSTCGMHPPVSDMTSVEANVVNQRPCLAHLMRNQSYATAHFSAFDYTLSNGKAVLQQEGWQTVYGMDKLLQDDPAAVPISSRAAEDKDILPPMSDWLDAKIAQHESTFMSWHTTSCHYPFHLPGHLNQTRYTELLEDQNGHLNSVRYVDGVLREFWEMLQAKNIADEALIVLHGDHGVRMGPNGYMIADAHNRNLNVPALISTPSTREHFADTGQTLRAPQSELWSTTDVLPTILDILRFPSHLIRSYPGQSMLRPLNERLVFAAQMPGKAALQVSDGRFKAIRTTDNSLDACGFDRSLDPDEMLGWCTDSGWMERDINGTTITGDQLFSSPQDALFFTEWVRWGAQRTAEHVTLNDAYWSNTTLNQELRAGFALQWNMTSMSGAAI